MLCRGSLSSLSPCRAAEFFRRQGDEEERRPEKGRARCAGGPSSPVLALSERLSLLACVSGRCELGPPVCDPAAMRLTRPSSRPFLPATWPSATPKFPRSMRCWLIGTAAPKISRASSAVNLWSMSPLRLHIFRKALKSMPPCAPQNSEYAVSTPASCVSALSNSGKTDPKSPRPIIGIEAGGLRCPADSGEGGQQPPEEAGR
mmetsp:Transcript_443/g.958  ORF Transcript_443/g.958 Transcript_443/m.958 type:complete len:203 (+) Transcript_443:647-1255(+)